ncbi:MAG: 16S rRNA (uracil(1498)-N(3))-methyltransferase [Treponema sp.]|nr:16S rRNA (uracil(1498)-N(3))-methyltransferase [Treponema sp.]
MRQFVSAVAPNSKGLLEITGKDFHYLRKVLRLSPGDMISLSLPGGVLQDATICKVDDGAKKIELQICDSHGQEAAARTRLVLLQFIPKPQKMELIVRQAVECGVAAIVPVIGEYTQAGFDKALQKPGRFEKIIREARQQSGSQVETQIFPPCKLPAALGLIDKNEPAALRLFLYERTEGTLPLSAALFGQEQDCSKAQEAAAASFGLAKSRAPKSCVYAVGCEGGISPAECELLLSRGFKAVHFNTNILRCETASLYAAAAIQSALDN